MKRIVVCPDSFKGSLSAREVSDTICKVLRERYPDAEMISLPLADGGEGTADVLREYHCFSLFPLLKVNNPVGRPVEVTISLDPIAKKAFIESAQAVGLPLLSPSERNPLLTNSYGLGQIIKYLLDAEYRDVSISLGGSGVNDGGMGMLEALGFIFHDKDGKDLGSCGENLIKIAAIDSSQVPPRLFEMHFTVLCDVRNPLYGENGAAYVFAPQKGATSENVRILDNGLVNLHNRTVEAGFASREDSLRPGTGAAGGLGYAFLTFLRGRYVRGVDFILETLHFEHVIKGASLIITGEGRVDRQSLMGKVLSGVLSKARKEQVPVIAVGGSVEENFNAAKEGLKAIYSLADPSLTNEENMRKEITVNHLRSLFEKIPL